MLTGVYSIVTAIISISLIFVVIVIIIIVTGITKIYLFEWRMTSLYSREW